MIHTLRQRHLLPVVTPAAILTGIGRVHFQQSVTSFCRFACQLIEERRPCRVTDAFGKAMVMEHTVQGQVLHADRTIGIDHFPAFLMGEVRSFEGDTFMYPRYDFAVLAPLRCPFVEFAMGALHLCQCLLFLPEKARIGYLLPIRQGSKRLEPHIYSYLFTVLRQAFWFALNGKAHVPFASRGAMNGTRLDFAPDRAVIDHLETPDFGEDDAVVMGDTETRLWEGETIVAVMPTETRIARRLTSFHAAEECLHSKVYPYRHILQELRMDIFEGWAFLFQYAKGVDLLIARQPFACLRVCLLALFQQVIVEPSAFIKGRLKSRDLLFRREETILKHFMHTHILVQSRTPIKRQGIPIPSRPRTNAAHIPMHECRGFTRRNDKVYPSISSPCLVLIRALAMHEIDHGDRFLTYYHAKEYITHPPDRG